MPDAPASPHSSLRTRLTGPVGQFTAAGILAVVAIGAVAFLLLKTSGHDEAIRDAKRATELTGQGVVAPALTPGVVDGDPRALRRFDEIVKQGVLGLDGIVRVKIWDSQSRIIYSDEPRLIGDSYQLGDDELAMLESDTGIDAEQTDLSEPENRYETAGVDLVEVYMPIRSPSGGQLLYETYIRSSFIASSGQRIWSTLAPVLIGALLLFAVLLLPLAARLGRQLNRGQREREALLQRAIDSSDAERRRIAQNLHDGVVQQLAGSAFELEAASRSGARGDDDRRKLAELGARLRDSVRGLRRLLVEIYPPDLHREGLRSSIADVIAKLDASGLQAELDVPADLDLSPRAESLLFRGAQEALRNVATHADALHVRVVVRREPSYARLEVTDDGRGFDTSNGRPDGHFGLRTLGDLASDASGRLEVTSQPGRGTTLAIEVPVP
jgi:two-component system NarL family sensor kinase